MSDLGKFLVLAGLAVAVIGVLLWTGLFPRWLGRLPGDIRIERGNSTVYFPIVTCIVVSIILTLASWLYHWIARK